MSSDSDKINKDEHTSPRSKLQVKPIDFNHRAQLYFNTFVGATTAEFFVYPIDVCKTRLHIQGEAAEKAGTATRKQGMIGTLIGMARNEGRRGLYAGLSCMIVRNLFFNCVRVVLYDDLRKYFMYTDEKGKQVLPVFRAFLASSTAGCIAQAIANPLDIVKIRMQTEGRRRALGHPVRVHNMVQALRDIYKNGGIRPMWKGVAPSCFRAMMMTAGDTGAYDISKRQFIRLLQIPDGKFIQFLASVSAGFVASLLSTPADVVKSRIMNQPTDEKGRGLHYKHGVDCFYKLVKEEGVTAMYKGFIPCWLRIGPWNIVFWTTLECLRRLQGEEGF